MIVEIDNIFVACMIRVKITKDLDSRLHLRMQVEYYKH